MLPEIEQMLILQDRDQKIRTLKLEEKAMPGQKVAAEQKLAAAKARLESERQKLMHNEVDRKKLELDAAAKRTSIAKYKTQQFETRKNDEYQALSNEIKRFEGDIQKIEDAEVDLMESAEQLKKEVAAAEAAFAASDKAIKSELENIAGKAGGITTRLAELEAERKRLGEGIPADLQDRYARLLFSKGDAAVVAMRHEVCMGCHMKVTTQTSVRVKGAKEITHCEQCGRILYFDE